MLAHSPLGPVAAACSPAAIEVFKTNIASAGQGTAVLRALHGRFPTLSACLDLQDCDRILRVESGFAGPGLWEQVQAFVRSLGVDIEALPD